MWVSDRNASSLLSLTERSTVEIHRVNADCTLEVVEVVLAGENGLSRLRAVIPLQGKPNLPLGVSVDGVRNRREELTTVIHCTGS